MSEWLHGSSECISLTCYCSHKCKETWKQRVVFTAEHFARKNHTFTPAKVSLSQWVFQWIHYFHYCVAAIQMSEGASLLSDCVWQELWAVGLIWPRQICWLWGWRKAAIHVLSQMWGAGGHFSVHLCIICRCIYSSSPWKDRERTIGAAV